MTKHDPAGSSPIPLVPLLITESDEEFKPIRQALYEELGPVGIIEQMYVDEFADIVWEILRLKRCKAGVTNLKFHDESARLLGSSYQRRAGYRARLDFRSGYRKGSRKEARRVQARRLGRHR